MSTRLRRRSEDSRTQLARIGGDSPTVSSTRLARVIDLGDKSGTASSVVAVVPVAIEVDRVEGAAPILTPGGTDTAFLALNLGASVPPVGLDVLIDVVDGIPVFRHG